MSLGKYCNSLSKSQFQRPLTHKMHFPIYSHDNLIRHPNESLLSSKRASPNPKNHNIYQSKNLLSNNKQHYIDSSSERRNYSSQGKNDLFRQLALKIQKQREQAIKINKQIAQEYYDQSTNKQNCLKKSNTVRRPLSNTKKIILPSPSSKSKERYKIKENEEKRQVKQKIKFNRVGVRRQMKVREELDLVRTSEGEFRQSSNKQSLDMNPCL